MSTVLQKTEAIEAIIGQASVCRLAMLDGDAPYIVPLCFGYRNHIVYCHSSIKSRKLDLIRRHPAVGFEMDILARPIPAPEPCKWSMRYQSVVGFGTASIVEDEAEKKTALGLIMAQYARGAYAFPENKLRITAVIRVDIERMTGKTSGFDD
jgi:nitroimidazol reductase NimA-like FMN-containing flavoprotein (pyridoxamine 5'-phosphate oxidase superfamily)